MNMYNLLVYSTFDGTLGCFHFLILMNSAARTFLYIYFWAQIYTFLLDIYPGAQLLSHKVCVCSALIDSPYNFLNDTN